METDRGNSMKKPREKIKYDEIKSEITHEQEIALVHHLISQEQIDRITANIKKLHKKYHKNEKH